MAVVLVGPNAVLRAMSFARDAGVQVFQPWMLWAGWRLFVGCDHCRHDGPDADCWGWAGCHRYEHGCGCEDCAQRHARERASAA